MAEYTTKVQRTKDNADNSVLREKLGMHELPDSQEMLDRIMTFVCGILDPTYPPNVPPTAPHVTRLMAEHISYETLCIRAHTNAVLAGILDGAKLALGPNLRVHEDGLARLEFEYDALPVCVNDAAFSMVRNQMGVCSDGSEEDEDQEVVESDDEEEFDPWLWSEDGEEV